MATSFRLLIAAPRSWRAIPGESERPASRALNPITASAFEIPGHSLSLSTSTHVTGQTRPHIESSDHSGGEHLLAFAG